MNTNRTFTKQWWKDTNKRTQIPGLARFGLMLAMLQMTSFTGMAMNIVTNCTDAGPSLPLPKRLLSACPTFGTPFVRAGGIHADPVTGGLRITVSHDAGSLTGLANSGLLKTDASGAFQWKLALANGAVFNWPDTQRFAAVQRRNLGGGPVVVFGVYDDSTGNPVPVFERELPIGDWERVSTTPLQNGMTVVALDKTNSIVLLGLNSGGELAWAKELSSPELPVITIPGLPSHTVSLAELGTNDVLLQVSATEMLNGTNTAKVVCIRLDSSAAVHLATKVQVPLFNSNPNPYVTPMWPTPKGNYILLASDADQSTFSSYGTVAKINASGVLLWAKRYDRLLSPQPFFIGSSDSLVIQLISSSSDSGIYAIFDSSGDLTAAARPALPAATMTRIAGVSSDAQMIYYCGDNPTNRLRTLSLPLIGSSSLALDNFSWQQYGNGPAAIGSNVLERLTDGRLLFSARDTNGQWCDLVMLDSNLTVQAECDLFSPRSFQVSTPSLNPENVTPLVTNVVFQVSHLTPTLPAAELEFLYLAAEEYALCSTNCLFTISASSGSFPRSATSQTVNITAYSTNCQWTVVNPCANWITVSPTNGTGSRQVVVTVGANTTGTDRSCEVTIAGRPFIVSQSGCNFAVSPLTRNFGTDGGSQVVKVTPSIGTQCGWTVQNPCASWLTVSSMAGTGPGEVTISVPPNATDSSRSCNVTISGWSFSVFQTACSLSFSPSGFTFLDAGGGTQLVTITANGTNCPWTVQNPCPDWLTVTPLNGTGSGQVTISASPNLSGGERSCRLTIGGSQFNVYQPDCRLTISRTNLFFGLSGGSNVINVTAASTNCQWTVQNPCADWITILPEGGSGGGPVTISVSRNSTGVPRSCELTVAGQSLLVSQSAVGTLPFRLFATARSSGGQHRLIELQADPVSESIIENLLTGNAPKIDFAPDGKLYRAGPLEVIYPTYAPPPKGSGNVGIGTTNGTIAPPVDGIAFSPEGTLYASDANPFYRPPIRTLFTVDLETGEAAEVGRETNATSPWAIDFGPDGRLFGAFLDLGETDPATGQLISIIGNLPVATGLTDIDYAPDGFIYGVTGHSLYRISPTTAATELVGVYDSELLGIASEASFAPSIQVISSANVIILFWPASATNYTLRYANEMTATVWTPVSPLPGMVGGQLVVTNAILPGTRFFQLQNP